MSVQTLYSTQIPNNQRTVNGVVAVRLDDVLLNVDTTEGAATINLCNIPSGYWNTEYVIYVKDIGGMAATNNITINAPTGFFINGVASFTMAANNETCKITISSNVDYLCENSASVTPGITALTIARTAFVAKNGSDSSGLIERLDKPFFTIAGAQAALIAAESTYYTNPSSGLQTSVVSQADHLLIKVFTGLYSENIVLSNYIDYDFSDCTIGFGLANTKILDGGVACNVIIYGSSNIVSGIIASNSGTNIVVYANSIIVENQRAAYALAGKIMINVPLVVSNPNDGSLAVIQTIDTGYILTNNSRIINNNGGYCINNVAGTMIINNCTLISNAALGEYTFVSSSGQFITVYGACQANLPAFAGTTQKISSVLIDSNVI